MSKTKKVTYGIIAGMLKKDATIKVKSDMPELVSIELEVKPTLSLGEMKEFVDSMTILVLDPAEGTYDPEMFSFGVRIGMMEFYAGLDFSGDPGKAYKVLYETDLYKKVWEVINQEQFAQIVEAAHAKIQGLYEMMNNASSAAISKLVNKMDDVMKGSGEMLDTLNTQEFKDVLNKLDRVTAATMPPAQIPRVDTPAPQEERKVIDLHDEAARRGLKPTL